MSHRIQSAELKDSACRDFGIGKGYQERYRVNRASHIVFRADSGYEIGSGHLMRCLTLADGLRSNGAEAVFVTREHRGHIIQAINDRGYQAVVLSGNTGEPYGDHSAQPSHARWLEADWRKDAAATRAVLEDTGADWLVVDHYALDLAWQQEALPEGVLLMVLDDLADRPHLADVLLDQNTGRQVGDYAGLVPKDCELRIGPAHALLRPEFALLQPEALGRRETMTRLETVLITLGGIDKDNVTGRVLDALAKIPTAQGLRITVVLGGSAPHLETVRARAAAIPMHINVVAGVSDMAQRMLCADLCIGAAGSTAWERCALGLPTLQVVLADNQLDASRSMVAQGLSLALPLPDAPEFAMAIETGLEKLSCADAYRTMACAAAALTDGLGAARLARVMVDWRLPHAH